MENKTNVTPELKQIYERVMETTTKTQLPTETPNPAEIAATTIPNPVETNNPTQNVEAQLPNPLASTPPAPQNPNQNVVQLSINPAPQIVATQNMATMAGTVVPHEQRKSRKPLFIVSSILFIILWAGFWAIFFGLINI